MDNKISLNTNSGNFFDRRLKILVLIAFLIFIWMVVIHFASEYINSNITQNWDKISAEKTSQQKEIVINLFGNYQSDVLKLSESICSNPDIVKQVQRSDSKKLFEELLKLNLDNSYQIEIFNTRLELLSFKGRKLESDVYSLQRSLNGKKFSIIKEIGFYTYLMVYSPVYDLKEKSQITGVLLTAKLIDIKYQINNKFFQNAGLLFDINKILNVSTEIIPANSISGKIDFDSSDNPESVPIDLKGIDNNVIGILLLPEYSQLSHIRDADNFANSINSLLVFGITIIFFLICLKSLSQVNSYLLRFIFFSAAVILIRFVWLEFHFPSKAIDAEIFSPGFYASTIGFGIARSIGELFITSVLFLIISIYGLRLVTKKRNEKTENTIIKSIILIVSDLLLLGVFFFILFLFWEMIQSIIFDSNLKFFDRASIIPSPELFIIQLIILMSGFSLFIFLSSVILLILKNSTGVNTRNKALRKYSSLFLLIILLAINQFIIPSADNLSTDNIYRLIIIVLTFSFGTYLFRKISLTKNYNVFTIKNFSLAILFCIIIVPGILLEKITSQETYFVELIGRKISEKEDDRIKFLLISELSNISESKRLEANLKNKNKLSELAFSVWTDSKFSEENFNTAIAVLDTNKRLLSDFIFNSQNLSSDSIIKFANINFFEKQEKLAALMDTSSTADSLLQTEEMEEEENETTKESEEMKEMFIADKIVILKNDPEKYYLGIIPLEKIDLKNTMFNTDLGYLMIAVQYESKNFLVQYSMQLFKNYFKDNLFDKLISNPIITEYNGGEIVSSTNQDLSKANTFSLDAFREAIKYKADKFDWRYETINNEKYRTFYILASPEDNSGNERIYSISLKRNDVKLTIFFYLKFILFAVFVYLIILAAISVFLLFKIKNIRLNFREKLFASFFIVSVIPIVLLAIYTRSFIKNKYDNNFQNQIISDLNLVSQSLKGIPVSLNNNDSLNNEQNQQILKSLNQTDKNFNLFLKTKLVSTTNEELYKSDLLDTRIDADAYYNIIFLRKDFFSKTEEIGVYSFMVGYKPLFDSKNNIIGLMSSQTVYRQNEINEELTEILTFIFGIYFIVIIILLIFVTFLTDRISKPILKLQNATERISMGESNVELKINRKDEIGNLVDSFNKMTKELESSKDKLKKAEREAAWKDIARRVAHEIKNPLTPMKLSIQHLYDVYNNGNQNNFSEVLKKTRTIIINEIDKLNKIATEFSNFAKLSGRNYEETDLNEVIEEVVSLYRLAPNVVFKEYLDKSIGSIFADKQELNRVFQNLIKNSIQAIGDSGIIEVKTYLNGEYILAEVTDNGSGIEPSVLKSLFEPNFSTKSTGMGLGLAITKKSLDDMKAVIHFESNINSGTKAIIKFKPYRAKK